VTGHRRFDDADDVAASVDSVLDRLLEPHAGCTVITSLAEGADRFVTEMIAARGGAIEVVLPLAVEDYERDFASEASVAEFTALLARASAVSIVDADHGSREAAYEAAGRAMVERSDVVIALWDGRPARGRGGTADIIQYALDRDVMVEVVLVERT
jgi:hypothetical protein